MTTSPLSRALALAAATLVLASGCSGGGDGSASDSADASTSAMALGTAKELTSGAATVDLSVDDIRAATDAEITDYGLTPGPDKKLWFVTWSITLKDGSAGDLDADTVYPKDDDWTGITNRRGKIKQTRIIGAGFDCTKDGTATDGISNDAPYVDCLVFQTGPDADLEAVTIADRGTWSTQP